MSGAMNGASRLATVVRNVTRRPSSKYGNPRMVLHTDNGVYVTQTDAGCAYAVSDYWTKQPVILTFNGRGEVIGVEELDVMPVLRMPAVNWDDLYKQKRLLVATIWNEPDSELWGIVHLLDAMQDMAEEGGAWKRPRCGKCGSLDIDDRDGILACLECRCLTVIGPSRARKEEEA